MLKNLRLSRVPADTQLQAWNAADEFLLGQQQLLRNPVLLVNDAFGALALALQTANSELENLDWWNDSASAMEALHENADRNNLPLPALANAPFADSLSSHYQNVVIHIPKSASYFSWQLEQIKPSLNEGAEVFALGMVKHINSAHIRVMNEHFQTVNPGRAEKKSRVICLTNPNKNTQKPTIKSYHNPLNQKPIYTLPGCFAEKTLDPGARAFIEYFDQLPSAKKVLDLACGNGVLAQSFLTDQTDVQLHLADDSLQAINSAKMNLTDLENCYFHHSNGANKIPEQDFDLVLCNPPFHQQATVTERIAEKLIADAAKVLTPQGQLWLVANRHLDYRKTLKHYFSATRIVSNDARFNVICCQK